jgi:hypothetical protein
MNENTRSAGSGADAVDAYVEGLASPQREIAAAARVIIDAQLPDIGAAVWHGHPVWSAGARPGERPVCLLKAYTRHVTLAFWNGTRIDDPSGRLEPGSRDMASVKLSSLDDVDADVFAGWLRQARMLATR